MQSYIKNMIDHLTAWEYLKYETNIFRMNCKRTPKLKLYYEKKT